MISADIFDSRKDDNKTQNSKERIRG